MEPLYWLAITTGFLGGFGHCSYMCTPIIGSLVISSDSRRSILFLSQILYHSGRVFTYGMIGFFMGYSGSFINTTTKMVGVQNFVSILVGIFLVLKGLEMLNILYFNKFKNIINIKGFHLVDVIVPFRNSSSIWKFFLYGLVLGLLPCGLSYSAFITSSGLGDPVKGFLFMILFGIGNIPALFVTVSFSSLFLHKVRPIFYRLAGIIFFVVGIWILYLNIF